MQKRSCPFFTERLGQDGTRPRIYQLFVRLFGNCNEARQPNGTLAINGVGKFSDINDQALSSPSLVRFFSPLADWCPATGDWHRLPAIGQPADDPDLLKGIAGSPYAIEDYFDVCPDYAHEPKERLAEFKALLDRIHGHGLKALIDFVPNHVARCYHSDVKPDLNFGAGDDRSSFLIRAITSSISSPMSTVLRSGSRPGKMVLLLVQPANWRE